jgi:hypothetical protein
MSLCFAIIFPLFFPSALLALKRTHFETQGKSKFKTADAFIRGQENLHPDNRQVKDKIRQQFQILRDAGLPLHVGRGIWRLRQIS